jgi:Flp pilus assembly protein CpaB
MKPFILAFLGGLVLASTFIAVAAFVKVSPLLEGVRKEWALTPIVVMARDVGVGEPITGDAIRSRSLPARFITDSMVLPNDVHQVVNRPSPLPLKAGDVLLWGMFADHSAQDACFTAIVAKVNAAGDAARDGVLSRFEERMGVPLPTPEPGPSLKADASGEVSIVVLKAEVPEGTVLDESMLAVGKLPGALATASLVPAEQLRDVIGTRAVVPLQPKDALMWQMLDDAEQPRRVGGCVLEVDGAMTEARARATREETTAFVRGQEAR